jgi:hypothetical protein
MTSSFTIKTSWQSPHPGPEEIRHTAAELQIMVGTDCATRVDDTWSQSVQDRILVAAYPLALWFASSWWRLRWETRPFRPPSPSTDWRMSHEMTAVGFGYLWPPLTFESDNETIRIVCHESPTSSTEPVRFLSAFQHHVSAAAFEESVRNFIELVMARLDTRGCPDSQLKHVWSEVLAERADPDLHELRKREAQLGFDPDEAPSDLVPAFSALSNVAGPHAADELTSACAGSDPLQRLHEINQLAAAPGHTARIHVPPTQLQPRTELSAPPFQRGWEFARLVRSAASLNGQPVSDHQLSAFLEIPLNTLQGATHHTPPPIALAVRNQSAPEQQTLHFRKRNRLGLRFEAARFLAAHLLSDPAERWLPVTDSTTSQQKAQRAFAAEFLCPIAALDEFLQHDFSDEAIELAADHFSVSDRVVRSQLVNNGRLPLHAMLIDPPPAA